MKKRNKAKVLELLKKIIKDLAVMLPIFFIAIIISVLAEVNIPDEIIQSILGENIFFSVFVSTIAGIILPFPQYASYPFANFLLDKGAYIGAIFAFVAGEVFIGNLFEDYLEIKYFSFRFWWMRFVVSFVLIFIAALLMQVLM